MRLGLHRTAGALWSNTFSSWSVKTSRFCPRSKGRRGTMQQPGTLPTCGWPRVAGLEASRTARRQSHWFFQHLLCSKRIPLRVRNMVTQDRTSPRGQSSNYEWRGCPGTRLWPTARSMGHFYYRADTSQPLLSLEKGVDASLKAAGNLMGRKQRVGKRKDIAGLGYGSRPKGTQGQDV